MRIPELISVVFGEGFTKLGIKKFLVKRVFSARMNFILLPFLAMEIEAHRQEFVTVIKGSSPVLIC
jgi:hypothetical protein